ncbi:class I SAM-dependent methyltransferase [Stieleria sp. JC731]|uniref:O-methyltransferase n=1 Tax=Pirellulaceae TaxID=2691357 RepID=UPI001E3D41C3|nr:class I SAM-dependent methyltransferase [Stieleria sp. JC731]MCC9601352.1 class I SAM-dependent methyltransferase [Stieleria sp. JC731]
MEIDELLDQIYTTGQLNDETSVDRSSKMLNITPSTGAFLDLLVSDLKPKRILELGTSNGYSTIWLARAAQRIGAVIDTVDHSPRKTEMARENLEQSGLLKDVTLHTSDGGAFLSRCPTSTYQLVFLDSDRSAYLDWADDLIRVTQFGLIVVDNAQSHPEELVPLRRYLSDSQRFSQAVLPIGKGQLIIHQTTPI